MMQISFGSDLENYRDLLSTVFTLILSLLGEFDFTELRQAHWLIGPVLFIGFVFVGVFVAFNILICTYHMICGRRDCVYLSSSTALLLRVLIVRSRDVMGHSASTNLHTFPVFLVSFHVVDTCHNYYHSNYHGGVR